MKKLFLLVVITMMLSGCGGGVGDVINVDEYKLLIGEGLVTESRVGYGNVPGHGTYFEHKYNVDVQIVNEGLPAVYEVRVYARPTNVINAPWHYLLQYGPIAIDKGAAQNLHLFKDTGTQGYGTWRVDVYIMQDGNWELFGSKNLDKK